jgi:hypothetical protein
VALALVILVLTGCDDVGNPFATSVQPFYTETDLETDPLLAGCWSEKGEGVSFTFEEEKQKGYHVLVREIGDGEELSGKFEARLLRLGADWFLDFFPENSSEGDDFYRMHFLRAHSIARLEIREDSLQMAFLSSSWLKKKIEEKSVDTPHEQAAESLLLTGTTQELQDLVFFHGNDEEAFSETVLLSRQTTVEVEP